MRVFVSCIGLVSQGVSDGLVGKEGPGHLVDVVGGKDVVVHWIQVTAGHLPVHSYYHNQDQLALQDQSFRGRTSLFKDQISRGNTSLQLTGVKVQDQGIYKCFISTIRGNKDSFINLNVDAPVVKVDFQQVGNNITCSSERIYPEPQLTWSTSPPSNVKGVSESGSLMLQDLSPHHEGTYTCQLRDAEETLITNTVLRIDQQKSLQSAQLATCTTLPLSHCADSAKTLQQHGHIILTQTRADVPCTVSEEWKQQVKNVSESGSLMLQNLSSHYEGTYTCELSDAEETLIINIDLRIEGSPANVPMTAGGRCLMITAFLWVLPFSREATEVSCVFMESCILPCGFQGGTDVVVHWIQITAGGLPVHSYYRNQDQLTYQGQSFRGRTSLFKDQISRGNASLQLTGVKVQDQGIYTCFTSTMRGNNVSERIYPEPELTCSTSPPSSVTFKNQTKVQETEQLLYTISGSLILSDTDLIYSCNISTRSNWRRVTFLKTAYVTASYHEATIPCSTSNTSFSGLIWRFNHSQIILTQTRADVLYKVSEEWKQQVKGVSESGSLMLQDLSSHHEGTYTCELSDAEETLISNTVLRIEGSPHEEPSMIVILVLKHQASISRSYHGATIPCTTSITSITGFSLTWRYNHSQIILTQTRADVPCTVSEEWKQQVKGVSESGSLMLQDLSSHHEGTYTCELSDAEETLITNTVLRIEGSPHEEPSNNSTSFGGIIGGVTAAVAVILGGLVLYRRRKQANVPMTAGGRCLMITAFLWVLLFPERFLMNKLRTSCVTDTEVSCVFMESCILSCSFQGGKDVVVHWTQLTAGDLRVHSYYHNQDQLAYQDQSFRGRTSLFKDQISRGNASLQLTGVKVQDQGRYKCFTSTIRGNQDSFINLKVDAPVVKVDFQKVGSHITCSSEGIYPEPQLTWSTSPPSNVTFKNQTKVQETEQLLYTISGSLILSDTDLIYSCNISTRSNWRRVTLLKTASVTASYHEATIPCTTSNTNFSGLIWRFNHSQTILTQTRADVPCTVSEEWKQQVKGVSESGSLMLQDLSSHHEGTYTCELNDAEETLITNTVLRIVEQNFSEAFIVCSADGAVKLLVVQLVGSLENISHIKFMDMHILTF
ncbi:hypothetical protein INR49_012093 [Caranx melampygus]|nr:hypothetical protein INR49_012093 [Caranx melampygus]